MQVKERRKHRRFNTIKQIGEPVKISLPDGEVSGAIMDLSVGGMALLTYADIPVGTVLNFAVDIPGLKTQPMAGKVVRNEVKGNLRLIAIEITNISEKDIASVSKMAGEFSDCENKIALGVSDVCFTACAYYPLCEKPQKIKKK